MICFRPLRNIRTTLCMLSFYLEGDTSQPYYFLLNLGNPHILVPGINSFQYSSLLLFVQSSVMLSGFFEVWKFKTEYSFHICLYVRQFDSLLYCFIPVHFYSLVKK